MQQKERYLSLTLWRNKGNTEVLKEILYILWTICLWFTTKCKISCWYLEGNQWNTILQIYSQYLLTQWKAPEWKLLVVSTRREETKHLFVLNIHIYLFLEGTVYLEHLTIFGPLMFKPKNGSKLWFKILRKFLKCQTVLPTLSAISCTSSEELFKTALKIDHSQNQTIFRR